MAIFILTEKQESLAEKIAAESVRAYRRGSRDLVDEVSRRSERYDVTVDVMAFAESRAKDMLGIR